LSANKATI